MSQFNERIVLQAIRTRGSMPKADLARLTNLSTQTVSLIINRLLDEGFVLKQTPIRGKVGQPSVPIVLNPDGAFSIGIKIGRRGLDLLLVDFVGQARERSSWSYPFPDPDTLFKDIEVQLNTMCARLGPTQLPRLSGIGIAAPLALGGWQKLLDITPQQNNKWDQIDILSRIEAMTELPVEFAKDTAAACVAELVSGRGRSIKSFFYLFVDTFIGGALVLNSHLHGGLHGNAGAVGSLPLAISHADTRTAPEQLLSAASLFNLEQLYAASGLDQSASYDERALQEPWLTHTGAWLDDAARAIAFAIISSVCFLDLESIVIDGSLDRLLLEKLLCEVEKSLDLYRWEGVLRPLILAGTIGPDAHAIGAALLPLYANFGPDRDLFLKNTPNT
ncbi:MULTISPECIES: ROK family transcriptional regulator [unclassified Undibacterium]|uniref:ROK family transcriptional regulator n=1 Tax=unclassified Undibacterium TaxID=2630295 RepID=UPI002AC99BCB|nr:MULTISPECIES: ROK family transcriptional regulator [unclassified Undibacterium]MEB0172434.1 ROK family transcriptional regulator [Undibacterium sp. CCC1.1]MEB0176952.1 ROK family transcriptional regulator [Undibacterium sp. CCC3.4]MEB0215556.1 ROK family transcriptional regulator [Undibacterium sp. 5I2]WPX43737.1 ROK family transcriptional regulator [Undibacterium sp. CCC3.4]